jgi:hypothetical protein
MRVAARARFLRAFVRLGTVTAACEVTRVSPKSVKAWREKDKTFAEAFAAAEQQVWTRRPRRVVGV